MFSPAGVLDRCWIAFPPTNGRGRDVGLFTELKEWLPAAFGGSGLLVAARLWFDARQARKSEKAAKDVQRTDLVRIAQDAAGAVIADLRKEADRLREQLDKLDAEFATFRKAHDTMIADKEAELALLRGKVRALEATVDAYERLLTANNIPHEKPAQPFFELRESELWPMPPQPGVTP